MNSLLDQVTPDTRALIWLTKEDITPTHTFYKSMDYLLDGLLTANHENLNQRNSHVLMGKNFGQTFFLMIARDLEKKELEGFVTVVGPELKVGQKILVLDETQNFDALKKMASDKIKSALSRLSIS